MENQSGIYEILNTANGKRYIGSTVSFKGRWRAHRRELRKGEHHSAKLQRAWNKYGEAAFKFLPILTCAPTRQMLLFYEQQLLDKVKPEYNIAVSADSPTRGGTLSAEHKSRIGVAHKGKAVSAETRKRQRDSHIGKVISAAAREKLSAAMKARVLTPEHKARIAAAHSGKTHSVEARAAMSAAAKARACTPEGKQHLMRATAASCKKKNTNGP